MIVEIQTRKCVKFELFQHGHSFLHNPRKNSEYIRSGLLEGQGIGAYLTIWKYVVLSVVVCSVLRESDEMVVHRIA